MPLNVLWDTIVHTSSLWCSANGIFKGAVIFDMQRDWTSNLYCIICFYRVLVVFFSEFFWVISGLRISYPLRNLSNKCLLSRKCYNAEK